MFEVANANLKYNHKNLGIISFRDTGKVKVVGEVTICYFTKGQTIQLI